MSAALCARRTSLGGLHAPGSASPPTPLSSFPLQPAETLWAYTRCCHRQCFSPCKGSAAAASPLVAGPPADFDFRTATGAASRSLIANCYPQLLPLVDLGVLVAVSRPEGYVERREDGYREPKLVLLVGTAHISSRSAEHVRQVVQVVQPQNIVVELCRSRAGVMYGAELQPGRDSSGSSSSSSGGGGSSGGDNSSSRNSKAANPLALGGGSLAQALLRSAGLGGREGLALRLLLAGVSGRLAGRLGAPLGGEMRAAAAAAEEVGAQVVLGDRPIEITLQRAAARRCPWRRRLRLLRQLVGASFMPLPQLDQGGVEELLQDDVVSSMFAGLAAEYPELLAPLVHERDLYLAWSLKRSKAVNGTKAVVAVVGQGHLRGLVYALTHEPPQGLRFSDLVGGRNGRGSRMAAVGKLAGRVAAETAVAAALWAAWEHRDMLL